MKKPSTPRFSFEQQPVGQAMVFSLTGVMDLEETAQLRRAFWDAIHQSRSRKLIVDLKKVPSLAPSAISLFVATKNMVFKKKGRLVLVGLNESAYGLLEEANLDEYFDIRTTVEEGLAEPIAPPEEDA